MTPPPMELATTRAKPYRTAVTTLLKRWCPHLLYNPVPLRTNTFPAWKMNIHPSSPPAEPSPAAAPMRLNTHHAPAQPTLCEHQQFPATVNVSPHATQTQTEPPKAALQLTRYHMPAQPTLCASQYFAASPRRCQRHVAYQPKVLPLHRQMVITTAWRSCLNIYENAAPSIRPLPL